jgi:hypothetical protein
MDISVDQSQRYINSASTGGSDRWLLTTGVTTGVTRV